MERITVYRVIGRTDAVCSLGHSHPQDVYGEKWLWNTGKMETRDWYGYGRATTSTTPIWMDGAGNEYFEVPPMDYYAGTTFRAVKKGGYSFSRRKPRDGVRFDELTTMEGVVAR